ncbi:glycine zipper 2TM domain-containing protein [Herminiimonas fonticola]|uniref:Glycine zipper 2TM protein n=1 Tax=Herminiimonas fonticola TaxID=303380 RepID=A0A4R6GHT6_9BURK|nr:glycine zipper 2TM domain-containing protein [Herminiimonas fonticola]RBA25427.1 Glycine zipper 2TM domain [Herminiimonas fonticola]TDN94541.1 glycine zipper 2TM protein [Herminiimonas fonticola]
MKTTQTKTIFTAAAVLSVALLAACATPYNSDPGANQYPQTPVSNAPAYNSAYGVVDSIQVVQQTTGRSGIGAGAVVGGVVGGLVGNQIGSGSGRTAATAAGVVGGALVGNQIQNSNQQVRDVYQIGVRLDSGAYQTMTLDSIGDLRVGNRVRIENGRVYRY